MTQIDTEVGLSARRAAAKSVGLTPEHVEDFVFVNGILEYRPVASAKKGGIDQSKSFPEMVKQQLEKSLALSGENQG